MCNLVLMSSKLHPLPGHRFNMTWNISSAGIPLLFNSTIHKSKIQHYK